MFCEEKRKRDAENLITLLSKELQVYHWLLSDWGRNTAEYRPVESTRHKTENPVSVHRRIFVNPI